MFDAWPDLSDGGGTGVASTVKIGCRFCNAPTGNRGRIGRDGRRDSAVNEAVRQKCRRIRSHPILRHDDVADARFGIGGAAGDAIQSASRATCPGDEADAAAQIALTVDPAIRELPTTLLSEDYRVRF